MIVLEHGMHISPPEPISLAYIINNISNTNITVSQVIDHDCRSARVE
jgi:hypothetical protein